MTHHGGIFNFLTFRETAQTREPTRYPVETLGTAETSVGYGRPKVARPECRRRIEAVS